jgi:K+-sensing histidine kinase KdpD
MTGPGAEVGRWPGWAGPDETAAARGLLRVYLGFAPGAGATCALLNEGRQLGGGPGSPALIRRAARLAARSASDLLALHVARPDSRAGARRAGPSPATLTALRRLTESLGGTFQEVTGDDIATALLTVAQAEGASQLVLGAPRHPRLAVRHPRLGVPGWQPSVTVQALRRCAGLDVHIVRNRGAAVHNTPVQRLPRPPVPVRAALRPAQVWAMLTGPLARMVDRAPERGQLTRVAAASVGEQPAGAAHGPRRR